MPAAAATPEARLRQQVAAEFAVLARELARAREGADVAVHRARKTIQRIRAKLRLLRGCQPAFARGADLPLRRLRRRLGRLRDAAVRVDLVRDVLRGELPADERERLEAALRHVRRELQRTWAATPARFWDRLQGECARLAERATRWPTEGLDGASIDTVLERARRRLRRALRDTVGHLQPGLRHELRRRLRRYAALRRAAAEVLKRRDPLAARLAETARSLGAEGDLWLTCTALRRAADAGDTRALRAGLERRRRTLCLNHDGALIALQRGTLRRRHGLLASEIAG